MLWAVQFIKRQLGGDLIKLFEIMGGVEKKDRNNFFLAHNITATRGCPMKLLGSRFRAEKRKSFSFQCVISLCNSLLQDGMMVPGVNGFQRG